MRAAGGQALRLRTTHPAWTSGANLISFGNGATSEGHVNGMLLSQFRRSGTLLASLTSYDEGEEPLQVGGSGSIEEFSGEPGLVRQVLAAESALPSSTSRHKP